jgi:hypothetical protein
LQTITREVCPANSRGMFQEAHERICRVQNHELPERAPPHPNGLAAIRFESTTDIAPSTQDLSTPIHASHIRVRIRPESPMDRQTFLFQ